MGSRASLDGCGKSRPPTGVRSPDRPARSESLYRLIYPDAQMLAGTDPYPGISLPSYLSHAVWSREGGNSSPVFCTGTGLGGLQAEYEEKDKRLP